MPDQSTDRVAKSEAMSLRSRKPDLTAIRPNRAVASMPPESSLLFFGDHSRITGEPQPARKQTENGNRIRIRSQIIPIICANIVEFARVVVIKIRRFAAVVNPPCKIFLKFLPGGPATIAQPGIENKGLLFLSLCPRTRDSRAVLSRSSAPDSIAWSALAMRD
jgi:hypothetical protein